MNYYIGNIPFDANYLEHHGILGMKWGQRNGPPYPLDAQDHSAAEKKAGWRKSLNDGASNAKSKVKKRVKDVIEKKAERGRELNAHPMKKNFTIGAGIYTATTVSKRAAVGAKVITQLLTGNEYLGDIAADITYITTAYPAAIKVGRSITDSIVADIIDKSKK